MDRTSWAGCDIAAPTSEGAARSGRERYGPGHGYHIDGLNPFVDPPTNKVISACAGPSFAKSISRQGKLFGLPRHRVELGGRNTLPRFHLGWDSGQAASSVVARRTGEANLSDVSFLRAHEKKGLDAAGSEAAKQLAALLDSGRICGDLLSLDYSTATVLVHDKLRADVGGVSKGCFLIATRLQAASQMDPSKEDTSLILLRVVDKAPLPNASETDRMRFDAG